MGYEINDTRDLEIPEEPDLRVTVKLATTFKEFNEFRKLASLDSDDGEALDAGFHLFGDTFLSRWNVTSGGEQVEPNGDNFSRLPAMLKVAILGAWVKTIGVTSGPLEQPSSNGLDSLEPSTTEPDGE